MLVTKQLMVAIDLHTMYLFYTMEVSGCRQFLCSTEETHAGLEQVEGG